MNTPDNDTNTYAGIADQYDALMTSGYYDYTIYADALKGALGHRRRVLEMGVGTGLVAEHLLERGPYDLVGIDNTAEMRAGARAPWRQGSLLAPRCHPAQAAVDLRGRLQRGWLLVLHQRWRNAQPVQSYR